MPVFLSAGGAFPQGAALPQTQFLQEKKCHSQEGSKEDILTGDTGYDSGFSESSGCSDSSFTSPLAPFVYGANDGQSRQTKCEEGMPMKIEASSSYLTSRQSHQPELSTYLVASDDPSGSAKMVQATDQLRAALMHWESAKRDHAAAAMQQAAMAQWDDWKVQSSWPPQPQPPQANLESLEWPPQPQHPQAPQLNAGSTSGLVQSMLDNSHSNRAPAMNAGPAFVPSDAAADSSILSALSRLPSVQGAPAQTMQMLEFVRHQLEQKKAENAEAIAVLHSQNLQTQSLPKQNLKTQSLPMQELQAQISMKQQSQDLQSQSQQAQNLQMQHLQAQISMNLQSQNLQSQKLQSQVSQNLQSQDQQNQLTSANAAQQLANQVAQQAAAENSASAFSSAHSLATQVAQQAAAAYQKAQVDSITTQVTAKLAAQFAFLQQQQQPTMRYQEQGMGQQQVLDQVYSQQLQDIARQQVLDQVYSQQLQGNIPFPTQPMQWNGDRNTSQQQQQHLQQPATLLQYEARKLIASVSAMQSNTPLHVDSPVDNSLVQPHRLVGDRNSAWTNNAAPGLDAPNADADSAADQAFRLKTTSQNSNTMRQNLKELENIDHGRIVLVRKINRLGLQSPDILKAHYAQYGKVESVLTPHSHVKLRSGVGWRLRPTCLGFVVMSEVSEVEKILADGSEQQIRGGRPGSVDAFVTISVQAFKQQGEFEDLEEDQ